jgi:chromosomal replication initiator protein
MDRPADGLDRFVQLPENRAAHRAVEHLAVAAARGIDSPLLFLHGPPGSGKSHLSGGLIERLTRTDSAKTAVTVAAAEFGRDLLQPAPVRRDVVREALDCDLLVIEDVQHLPAASSDEVAAVLDRRQSRHKVTMVTAVRSPADLSCSARLAGRFAGGLASAIQPLGEPSRRELASALCRERQLNVAADVIPWLARDPGGARPILGDIARLERLAKGRRTALTLAVVTSELPAPPRDESPMARVIDLVGTRYRLSPKAITGPSRVANVVRARHLAMFLGRELGLSLVLIGSHLGGRDHTTVMHGCGKIASAAASDPKLSQEIRDLRAELV